MRLVYSILFVVMIAFGACKKDKSVSNSQSDPLYSERTWTITKFSSNDHSTINLPDEKFNLGYVDENSVAIPSFAGLRADTTFLIPQQSNDTMIVYDRSVNMGIMDYNMLYYPQKNSLIINVTIYTSIGPNQNISYLLYKAVSK